jgi:hypothetical protein
MPPERLTIIVENGYISYALGKAGNVGQIRTDTQWGGDALASNAAVTGLHRALNRFRERFTEQLNTIDEQALSERLASFEPRADWDLPPNLFNGSPVTDDMRRWEEMETSDELWELAEFGHQLYQAVFRTDSRLRSLIDELAGGALLEVQWQRHTRGRIPNLPWMLMYAQPPSKGKPIDPRNFLGLRHRIGYLVNYTRDDQGLGNHGMYVYYWDGDNETLAESRRQHDLWAGPETYHVVPGEPGRMPCEAALARSMLIDSLRQPPWNPLALIYLFCIGDMVQEQFLLYFTGGEQEVILPVQEIPSDPLRDSPLIFVNACKAGGASDPTMGNPLEQRFLDRACRAFLGPVNYIPIRLASQFAQIFFHFLKGDTSGKPIKAGEAVSQARRFLWEEFRNLGGLFYSYVNDYHIYLADGDELARKLSS